MTGPEAMKKLRKERDVSQQDLAVAIGVTTGAISQYEREVHTPRRRVVQQIDDHLEAGGEVLRAFGYSIEVNSLDEVDQLRRQVGELAALVRSLDADVEKLGAEVVRLGGSFDRAARSSS